MSLFKFILLFFIIFFIYSCNEQTLYYGKIINQESINNLNIENKQILIEKFGYPSFIDPIENKYFYFTEKKTKKNFFSEKIEYNYLFVFQLNDDEKIISKNVFNLLEENDLSYIKDETKNPIIKRGLIERVFGGIGTQQLPGSLE